MKLVPTVLACAGITGASMVALLALGGPGAARSTEAAPPTPPVAHAAQAGYGTIKGRLVWGGDSIPEQPTLNINKDQEVCGKVDHKSRELVVDPDSKGIQFGLAYLMRPKGSNPQAEKELLQETPQVVLDQEGCEFVPYIVAMNKGQEIVFKSSDPVSHNVRFGGFSNPSKNTTVPPNGDFKVKFAAAERLPMEVKCDIHPWMKAWILVVDHPFFAVTKEDGSFEIQGVPAGEQNLVVWQEKVGFATEGKARGQKVSVKPGETIDLGEIVIKPGQVK